MPNSIVELYEALEHVAAYDGPWTPLRAETGLLRERLEELRAREDRLDDLLVVALVGGSGVGKSTLLNAIAGDELARTSEMRPCTTAPTVYHPPGARMETPESWTRVSGSALEQLVLIDTPDSDTIVEEHREHVIDVLRSADLIMICADAEKYLDDATWSLLRPLQGERTMVCVETKATRGESIREHWLERLEAQGFEIAQSFRVDSRRTFDRKAGGGEPGMDEYDFPALETFLESELTKERIARIKRSNTAGLMRKTVGRLVDKIGSQHDALETLGDSLTQLSEDTVKECAGNLSQRLFAQPHLWTYAMGREIAVRSKGVVGTLYRLLEIGRTLPARIAAWSPLRKSLTGGHGAAALLTETNLVSEEFRAGTPDIRAKYESGESEARLMLARAGFEMPEGADGYPEFERALSEQTGAVLRGPARARLQARAARLTSWPVTLLLDAPPVGFFVYTGYSVVNEYFSDVILPGTFFVHAGSVLGIILASELLVYSAVVRASAWRSRRNAQSELNQSLAGKAFAFERERAAVTEALAMAAAVRGVAQAMARETNG